MEFNVITGYYVSHRSFHNNADADNPGQGILQGSSSTVPIYNIYVLKDDHTIVTAAQSNTKTWSEMMCLQWQFESG